MDLPMIALAFALAVPGVARAADGTVLGFAFEDGTGAPLQGLEIAAGGQLATTDAVGRFTLTLAPGAYPVAVRGFGPPGSIDEVVIASGETTELLLTLSRSGGLVGVQREEPGQDAGTGAAVDGPTGVVGGRLTHEEDGRPVVGARVFVRGVAAEAVTGPDGRFSLSAPAGLCDLSIVAAGFVTLSRTVEVAGGGETQLDLTLTPAGIALADFTITAPRIEGGTASLLAERQQSSTVSDSIGAEQMARSGDSTAAAALRRVTGLTVVDGKYVYVRGLGERYSASLLNGATLPSPEPERRVVPLDMFPPSVLDSIVIQKTMSPDMPAEFGGGAVVLRTRSVPADPFFSVGLSGGWDFGTTMVDGMRTPGGPTDWLGIDGGFRDLPEAVQEASDSSPLEEGDMFSESGYSASELEALGEAMGNAWSPSNGRIPPDAGLSLAGGVPIPLGSDASLGLMAGGSWGQGWESLAYHRTYTVVGANDALEAGNQYDFAETTRSVGLGGIGVVRLEVGEHAITSTTLALRDTDDEARIYQGFNRDVGADIRVTRVMWVERMLLTEQVLGHHPIGHVVADWRYTFSRATRLEPDRRETRYDNELGTDIWLLSDRPEGNQRVFSDLVDTTHDIAADLGWRFNPEDGEQSGKIQIGGLIVDRDRTVDTRRFKYMHKGELSRADEVLSGTPESIFVPDNIGADGFQFEEITRETDNYSATQDMLAAYGMLDTPITSSTRVLTGVRMEKSRQVVSTFELFNPDAVPVEATIDTLDVLPALTVTQGLGVDGMQLRAGYGRTVSRPEFREMSPATFNDVTGGRQTFGNEDLERATIDNLDLRWEFYPTPGESISVAGFYKQFHNPIETIVVVSAQHSVTYDNALGARNVGVELDWRKSVGGALQDVYFSGNLALIRSRVTLDEASGIQTSSERALQGQSPYVANLQLGYEPPEGVATMTVLYNSFGRRLAEVGALGAPDTFEEPVHLIDVVGGLRFGGGWSISLKAKNLLDPWRRYTQGDMVIEEVKTGREVSLGLGWKAG